MNLLHHPELLERLASSYALGTLWQVVPVYGFLYLLCFASVAVFGTTTPRKITNGSFVVLIGGFLPLFAMGLWEYTHTKIPYGEIMDLQKGAYTTLLVTNGIMLLLINIVAHGMKRGSCCKRTDLHAKPTVHNT